MEEYILRRQKHYEQQKQAEERERLEEERKKFEAEQEHLEELRIKQYNLDCVKSNLKKICMDIRDIKKCDIIRLELFLASFTDTMIQNEKVIQDNSTDFQELVLLLIDSITNNDHIKFDIHNLSPYENKLVKKIPPRLTNIFVLVEMDPSIIEFNLMDTSNDEQLALELQQKLNVYM